VNYAFATTSTSTLNTVVFQNNVCHDGNSNFYLNTATTGEETIQGNTLNGMAWSGNRLRISHGSAPSSPKDGEIWTTTTGLYVRINGSTIGPLS
jgi:hypothetical protein